MSLRRLLFIKSLHVLRLVFALTLASISTDARELLATFRFLLVGNSGWSAFSHGHVNREGPQKSEITVRTHTPQDGGNRVANRVDIVR